MLLGGHDRQTPGRRLVLFHFPEKTGKEKNGESDPRQKWHRTFTVEPGGPSIGSSPLMQNIVIGAALTANRGTRLILEIRHVMCISEGIA